MNIYIATIDGQPAIFDGQKLEVATDGVLLNNLIFRALDDVRKAQKIDAENRKGKARTGHGYLRLEAFDEAVEQSRPTQPPRHLMDASLRPTERNRNDQ